MLRRSAQQIYDVVSRFDNLTPALADRVEEWQADEDTCSFKAKGFTVKLRIAEKEAPKTIKIVGGDGGVPMDFAFWIQLHKVSDTDTRMRLVLHAELDPEGEVDGDAAFAALYLDVFGSFLGHDLQIDGEALDFE